MSDGALRHVYWVGGGSGAGKSTVARRLTAERGLRVCSSDASIGAHTARLPTEDVPYLASFLAMDMDERWSLRAPEAMLETFPWFRGEGFELMIEDLAAMPRDPPVVAEGFRLLPSLVAPWLDVGHRTVWLLPTPEFRRAAFDSRGTTWDIPNRTRDPERALRNLLERDALFTDRVADEAQRLGLPVVHVRAGMTEQLLTARVSSMFGL